MNTHDVTWRDICQIKRRVKCKANTNECRRLILKTLFLALKACLGFAVVVVGASSDSSNLCLMRDLFVIFPMMNVDLSFSLSQIWFIA